jgi:pimeloyl-ACP methyl ester carboxylesterase
VRTLAALPLALLLAAPTLASSGEAAPDGETVILLHGLLRSDRSMRPLERRLAEAGYRIHNLDYPSTELPPEELVANLDAQLAACCAGVSAPHFVTHSLGGVLLRAYLTEHAPVAVGRVVMLAPPNHGSELADVVAHSPLLRAALGPTAAQLGTNPASLPNRLPPADFELGIVAGTRSINPLSPWLLPGASDGTVSVASARLHGMTDFVTVPTSHTRILRSDEAAAHVVEFLRDGRFHHGAR